MIEIALLAAALIVGYFGLSFLAYRRRFPPIFNIVLGKVTFEQELKGSGSLFSEGESEKVVLDGQAAFKL